MVIERALEDVGGTYWNPCFCILYSNHFEIYRKPKERRCQSPKMYTLRVIGRPRNNGANVRPSIHAFGGRGFFRMLIARRVDVFNTSLDSINAQLNCLYQ